METTAAKQRNYQLDFIKLIFTLFVFLCHAGSDFANENTVIPFQISLTSLGYVSVQVFFTISGLLMINTLSRKESPKEYAGANALSFTINKYKAIALPYVIVLILNIFIYLICRDGNTLIKKLPYLIPELFALPQSGNNIVMIGAHTWYISAMLVALLPLAYLFLRNRDLYINILAPFGGAALLGFMMTSEFSNGGYLNQYTYCGVFLGGTVRAACGILLGGVSWIIYKKLTEGVKTKTQRVLLTILESVLYVIFFTLWFNVKLDVKYSNIALMIIPVIIGIVFSQQSYISRIFESKIFKTCGSLSLAIYLTHWGAEMLIMKFFPDESFKFSLLLMVGITAALCCIYYLVIYLCRLLWRKKLRRVFVPREAEG